MSTKEWREKNKEKIREYKRKYKEKNALHNKKYYLKNKEKINKRHRHYRVKNWCSNIIGNIKSRTKNKYSQEIDFDSSFLRQLVINQKGKCYWSGLKMIEGSNTRNPFQISVDRIDNNKPYTKDNIVLCCLMINYARNSCDYDTWNDIMKNQISIKYRRKKS